MHTMTRSKLAPLAAVLAAALAGCAETGSQTTASASADEGGRSCFYARNLTSWAPMDDTTVNLRVNAHDFYQLKLLGPCPNINWIEAIGIEHRGTDWICSGLDATVIAHGAGGPNRCPAISVRRLSPAEAAALPPKARP